ncbi:MAG: acylneuraminate cytidylyltransferase family protein [Deltaproteobacteria bacterium]|jgi:N-acylneuraminate cytidylyltransferase|nr:acylneuraminate cytidylyltransferase family protein [Deltaproteobacteria bacterium]
MYLGIIPARGGSKGIPRKNIKLIAGHPLIAWTIKDALESRLMDSFVVSSEDREILEVAQSYGAPVLERPPQLAGDEVLTRDVLVHALRVLGGDAAVLLQCTSPARRPGRIDEVIKAFESAPYDSMSTGFDHLNYPPFGTEHRRQDLNTVFVNDGSIIVTKSDNLRRYSLFGENAGTFVTTREENVDIDAEFDFWLAEKILEKGIDDGWLKAPVRVEK